MCDSPPLLPETRVAHTDIRRCGLLPPHLSQASVFPVSPMRQRRSNTCSHFRHRNSYRGTGLLPQAMRGYQWLVYPPPQEGVKCEGPHRAAVRYGGIKLYRRAIPGFLGFALGHVFAAGVAWGLLGAAVPDLLAGCQVWFG